MFKDRLDKNRVARKFTFPNVREGTIIEYEYRIVTDYIFYLYPWDFQGAYPRLWSEYNVSMPEFYNYVTLTQGYHPYYIADKKDRRATFNFTNADNFERAVFSCGVTDYHWVMKDVPAIREERYTSTIENHLSRIRFQLAAYREPYTPKDVMGTWPQACIDLLKREDFGQSLLTDNGWLNENVREATGSANNELDKARSIYQYVRDRFTCSGNTGVMLDHSLRSIVKSRKGTEAELNMLLTAMLLKAGLFAEPVILGTRNNGYTYEMYPLMDRFNYVITRLVANGREYFLDASRPNMGFGRLSPRLYNGHARVVNESATPVNLTADSLFEGKTTSVFIVNDEKGGFNGTVHIDPGYYESSLLRDKIAGKGQRQFFEDIKAGFSPAIEITESSIDSLNDYEYPIGIHYSFKTELAGEDILYFNPMFSEGMKDNPFRSSTRLYPVEMDYAIDQIYLLRLDVPAGYKVEELPQQLTVKLNGGGDGFFEYRIVESKGVISLRSRLQINRAFFGPGEYESLREFFNHVVKKHAEQIVFKKK
jgi:hypothetical protein